LDLNSSEKTQFATTKVNLPKIEKKTF